MMIHIVCPHCGHDIYIESEDEQSSLFNIVQDDISAAEELGFIFGEEVNEDGSY